jgi:hypothetical protein
MRRNFMVGLLLACLVGAVVGPISPWLSLIAGGIIGWNNDFIVNTLLGEEE